MLEVKLLGQFEVKLGGQPVSIPSRPAQALFAYLILNAQAAHRREQLAGLLWPDTSDENARNNLRHALWRIRKAIETKQAYLIADDLTIRFDPDSPYWLDARAVDGELRDDLTADDLIVALANYRGELLPGFYEEWVTLERERLQAMFERKMEQLLDCLIGTQRWAETLEWGEKWIAFGQTPEPAYRALMLAHAGLGNSAKVAATYDRCVQALNTDLGVPPSGQTRALYQQLLSPPDDGRDAQVDRAKRQPAGTENRSDATETPSLAWPAAPITRTANIPSPLTSFIGRAREIEEVKTLLATNRLVTLAGAGGSGKTRLAIAVANAMSDIFQDGVAWIDLSSLADGTLLTPTIAKIFSVHELPSQFLSETLANNLRSKQLLLILDNCEHLVEACANLAELLLRACPRLQVLTTSREVLSLTGELIYQVPTLALPDQQTVKLPEALMQYAGIQLFVDRARLVKPDFALNQLTAPLVIQVCQRLDGIPLAIELAAARLKILSVEQIALRLGDRFDLLTAGNRTALPHQQTLRAALDWSYDLLDEEERLLFRRLAVFVGGFNLDAAEVVCTGAPLNSLDILNLMGHLVDKSLVIVEPQGAARHEQTRYRMLETIREYAREKLEASGESQTIRDRHLEFFLQMAEKSESEFYSSQQLFWLGRWEAEIDNLRAALKWSADRVGAPDSEKYTEAGLRLGGAGTWFWDRGYRREHLERLNEMLSASTRATLGRGKALVTIGFLRWTMNDFANARLPLKEAITIARQLDDRLTLIWSLGYLGGVENALGDPAEAQLHLEEGLALRQKMVGAGRNAVGWILSILGDIPYALGNYQRAQMLFEESAAILRETHDRNILTYPLRRLGFVAVKQGEFSRAADFFTESLACNQEVGHSEGIIRCIAAFASLGAAQGKFTEAVQLCGAVARLLESMSASLFYSDKIEYELNVSTLRAQLDEKTFAQWWAKGAALTLEQAVAFALETRGEL